MYNSNYNYNKSRLEKRLSFSLKELSLEIEKLDVDVNYVSTYIRLIN